MDLYAAKLPFLPPPTTLAPAPPPAGAIFIVDDDASVRDSLSLLFRLEGYRVETFRDGDSFIAAVRDETPACVILDVHLAGRSGLDILNEIAAPELAAPIFVISGQGDIPTAVQAVKRGAFDFIEKPFRGLAVVDRVNAAIKTRREHRDKKREMGAAARNAATERNGTHTVQATVPLASLASLTPREHDVLAQIAAGASNKEAGRTLRISPRTVEVHRARIMEKLGARNAADLVRIVLGGARTRPPPVVPCASHGVARAGALTL
jgi:two-component system response regulator FixJ